MTTTLPAVRAVLETYRTCELVTVGRDGVPVAWPAVCSVAPAGDVVTLTTSIALPVKALNVRRDPRVALLFSDPTGTGRDDLPQVLLRGTATCPEKIHTSPAGLEDYWLKLWQRQPDVVPTSPRIARAVMDFYYLRLVLTVSPQEVTTSAPLRRAGGGRSRSGPENRPGDAAHRLAAHPDAVLTVAEATAPPRPVRVRVAPGTCAGQLVLTPVDGATLDHVPPGSTPANLMAHAHDDRLGRLEQIGVVGRVDSAGGACTLTVVRALGAPLPSSPWQMPRTLHRLRRTTRHYLQRRGLPRPHVAWDEFEALRTLANAGT
jgi:hypothetical protein